MSSRITLVSAAVLATVLTGTAQSPDQKKPPADPQRPTFRTEANFVRVDVFPSAKGTPVRDLTAADFEILEDGVPQAIETFEFVQVRSGTPQEQRQEPNTIAASRDAMRNPRARVFVLFLDVPHVSMAGSWNLREPLVRLLDRVLGEEDLVGIMTPGMAASDIVFARKTQVIAGGLQDKWPWGERFTLAEDQKEFLYKACYPWDQTADVVREMVARRRERLTLDALDELVLWLRNEREERKAIITISDGWRLYPRNVDLTRPRVLDARTGTTEPIPGPEPIGVGPDGRLRVGETHPNRPGTKTECDRDRQYLSQMDNERFFRQIIDDANRANASFYTIDPRGLAVFDSPIGPDQPPPPSVDMDNLRHRIDTLRVLADNTDGMASVASNDFDRSLRRISDDLTSYYLLGYYTSNTRLDGRFRQITVRVKRPGVDVRARRGYRAATEEEVAAAKAASAVVVPEAVASARAALGSLARLRGSAPLKTRAMHDRDSGIVWIAGEFGAAATQAANAELMVTAEGKTVNGTSSVAPGQRGFVAAVPIGSGAASIDVRIRVAAASDLPPLTDMVRVTASEGMPHPLLFRRGPATGNRVTPVAEPAFSRTERAQFEIPLWGDRTLTAARLLDRNGNPVELPVAVTERTDGSGAKWGTAEITLAPLGAGDYVLELSGRANGSETRVLTGFRVTR